MAWNGGHRAQWLLPVKGAANPASLRFLNEPNAGDGGFIRRSGNRMIHSNTGQRFRARGSQLGWQAAFPSVANAPQVAKTLADLGVNYIRLVGDEKLHGTPTTSGFWFDNTAADYMTFDTTPDPDNFLRLWDNFQYELKKVGIYVCLCLYDIKPYPAATRPLAYQGDTWPGPGNYGKGIHILDVNKNQAKAYLYNLLTRPNSVTGIAPINDPAYSDVYIINEASVTQAWYQSASSNNFDTVRLIGQARTDMVARWNAFAASYTPSLGPFPDMVAYQAPAWNGGPVWATASVDEQTAFMQWLEYEDRIYAEEMYAYIRSIGWKAVIRISTANYVPISQQANDCLTTHCYAAGVSGGVTPILTTSTTRVIDSPVVTVVSAAGLYIGCQVQAITGMPQAGYIIGIAGLNITLNAPCTTPGTTSTSWYTPFQETSLNYIADHTASTIAANFTQVRDFNKPYITDEIGMKSSGGGVGLTSACYYAYLSLLVGLHDTDGYACFIYLAPQTYPAEGLNENTYAASSLHSEMAMGQSLLGLMVLNLLTEKGYMSPLTGEVPIKINYANLIARMVAIRGATAYALPTGIVGASQLLQKRTGLIYTGVGGEDTTGTACVDQYPTAINFSGVGVKTTVIARDGDKYTWDRSRDGGTWAAHESTRDLVYFNVLPTSFTSAINGVTIAFPPTLSVTGTCTSGSAVITVPDASSWQIGDYVAIAGVYFLSSNPQRIARVCDINIGTNQLTLCTEGGFGGFAPALAQQSFPGTAAITRPQWGVFALISMDGSPLGQGKSLMICNGTSWPMDMRILTNTEYANSNCAAYPNGQYISAPGHRGYTDLPVGKITFPNAVRAVSVDAEGKIMTVANNATSFGLVKNPLYIINPN